MDLRRAFIQLLFSLAISQVALRLGDLIVANASVFKYHYAYLQLLLCVFIITTSWVGWHNSKSSVNSSKIRNVISYQFAVLFIDLILVILYFIIVRGTEGPIDNSNLVQSASSKIELTNTLLIFFFYLVWDIITKFYEIKFVYSDVEKAYKKERKFDHEYFLKRISPTLICFVLSIIFFILMRNEIDDVRVSIIDLVLISLFYTFRGYKQDLKIRYELESDEISDSIKSTLNENSAFPITIIETKRGYRIKLFLMKILPIIMLVSFCFLYCYLK